jgi:hypothetical protein
MEEPQGYIERHPLRMMQALEAMADDPDAEVRRKATQAIVDNIRAVSRLDEGMAARALLTVINKSDDGSLTQHRALTMRPGIIDSLASTDSVQAVLLAQKGIQAEDLEGELTRQSCELSLKHLDSAFMIEPVIAAHAACNIARKTAGDMRDRALWMLLSHVGIVTQADFDSGHAAAEQAVLLGTIGTPLYQSALGMWEWHIGQIMAHNPAELVGKIFYGFSISTANGPNKLDLYEHGFNFLLCNPAIFKEYAEKIVRVSLGIGLRTSQVTNLHQKTVEVWLAALQQLSRQNLRQAIQAANEAMTFTPPGSQFERQAQMACCYLKRLDDDITTGVNMVYTENSYAH